MTTEKSDFEKAVLEINPWNGFKEFHELDNESVRRLYAAWLSDHREDIANYISFDCMANLVHGILLNPCETTARLHAALLMIDLPQQCRSSHGLKENWVEGAYERLVSNLQHERRLNSGFTYHATEDDCWYETGYRKVSAN